MFCNPLAESWAKKYPNYCMKKFVIYALSRSSKAHYCRQGLGKLSAFPNTGNLHHQVTAGHKPTIKL